MRITHNDAISLESVVRNVFSCDRAGMGGYIDADHFESAPFDAALIALAPLWQKGDLHEIEDFLFKWEHILRIHSESHPTRFPAPCFPVRFVGLFPENRIF